MGYKTPLEARLAKKVTKAISDYGLLDDGDRVTLSVVGRDGADHVPRRVAAREQRGGAREEGGSR